jgi:hypothetical protein
MGGKEKIYKGTIDCLLTTLRKEGYQALFKGFKANTIKTIPNSAIQFLTFDMIQKKINELTGV